MKTVFKKCSLTVLVLLVCLMLTACQTVSISGTPSEVMEKCQSVPTNEKPWIEVTGYVDSGGVDQLEGGSWSANLADKASAYSFGKIMCFFEYEPDIRAGQRVTVVGKASSITSSYVALHECKLK